MKDFDGATAVLDDEPYLETGPAFKATISKSTVLQAATAVEGYLTLPLGDELFECKFSAQANDLLITLPDESEILVLRYFSQPRLPSLVSETGYLIHAETVETIAGVKPLGSLFHVDHAPAGHVTALEGVAIIRRQDGSRDSLFKGASIFTGDILITDIGGELEVTFRDGNAVTVIDAAIVTVNRSSVGGQTVGYSVGLFKGSLDIATPSLEGMALEALTVHTPVASVYARPATRGHIHRHREGYSFCLEAPQNELEGWMDIVTRNGSRSLFQHTILMTVANSNDIPKQQTNLKLAVTQPTIMTFPTLATHISEGEITDAPGVEAQNPEQEVNIEADSVKTNETVDEYSEPNGSLSGAGADSVEDTATAPTTTTTTDSFMASSIFTLNQLTGKPADATEEQSLPQPPAPPVPAPSATAPAAPAGEAAPLPPIPPAPPVAAGNYPPLPSGLTPPPIPPAPPVFPPVSQSLMGQPSVPPAASFIPPAPPVAETEAVRAPAFVNDEAPAAESGAAETAAEAPAVAAEAEEAAAVETAVREEAPLPEELAAPQEPAAPSVASGFAALEERLNARFEQEPIAETPAAPQATQPDAAQPDAAQPDAIQPEAVQPSAVQPEVSETKPPHTADVVLGAISGKTQGMPPAVPANEAREEEPLESAPAIEEAEAAAPEPVAAEEPGAPAAADADTALLPQEDVAEDTLPVTETAVAESAPEATELLAQEDVAEDAVDASAADLLPDTAVEAVADAEFSAYRPDDEDVNDLPAAEAEDADATLLPPTIETADAEPEPYPAFETAPLPSAGLLADASAEPETAPFTADRMVDLDGFSHKRLGFARVGDEEADLEISMKDESGDTQHRILFKQFFKQGAPRFQITVNPVAEAEDNAP